MESCWTVPVNAEPFPQKSYEPKGTNWQLCNTASNLQRSQESSVNSKYKSYRQLGQGKLQKIMNKPVMLSVQYLYTPMRLGSLEFSLTKVGSLMYFVKALAKNSG